MRRPDIIITPEVSPLFIFHDLWNYRDLLVYLVWRDYRSRYRQTFLGVIWAVLSPLLTAAVFSLIFGHQFGALCRDVPYSLYCLAGLAAWNFFATGVGRAANSLIASQHLIRKTYFPRLFLPLAAILVQLYDLAISIVLVLVLELYYGRLPTLEMLALPLTVVMLTAASLGAGAGLAALNVRFRDVAFLMPFLLQLWLFCTPVFYLVTMLAPKTQKIYQLNPLVGIVEAFRASLLGAPGWSWDWVLYSSGPTLLLLIGGIECFRRTERDFADSI